MTHHYELVKFNDDESTTCVKKITAEPKDAKQEAKKYAEENPGIYSLRKVETTAFYFTEKEIDKKNKDVIK